MQDAPKAVWNIPYVSVAFFPSLKQNFIAYCSSKVLDCIFEIHQRWQLGFSRVYTNCCCSCSFEAEIINIGQSTYNMYRGNILNFQESTIIRNAHTKKKKAGNLSCAPHIWYICTHTHTHTHTHIYIYTYIYIYKFIYIYIHIYTHTHTHAHTHIYIYIYSGGHKVQNDIVSSEKVGITFYLRSFRFYNFHRQ